MSISSPSISTTTIHSKQRRRRRVVCVSVSDSDKGTTEASESTVSDSGDDPGALNGSVEAKQSTRKRSKARERLKAARVLSRYSSESKAAAKPAEMGSNVLDAMRRSDGGKRRSGLPEAPTNLFDDSKRGLPKPGWTFQFPGGSDLFFIVVSFVLISSIMFTTTYIVWKVGAIHFNEY